MVSESICEEVKMTDWHLMQMADLATGVPDSKEREIVKELSIYGSNRVGIIGAVYSHLGSCDGCADFFKGYVNLFSLTKKALE